MEDVMRDVGVESSHRYVVLIPRQSIKLYSKFDERRNMIYIAGTERSAA